MDIIVDTLIDGLEELSDAGFQERVWTGRFVTEMSSIDEYVERIFGDSGLDLALTRGMLLDPSLDKRLRELSARVREVDEHQPPDRRLRTPELQRCRSLAETILDSLRRNPTVNGGEPDDQGARDE